MNNARALDEDLDELPRVRRAKRKAAQAVALWDDLLERVLEVEPTRELEDEIARVTGAARGQAGAWWVRPRPE